LSQLTTDLNLPLNFANHATHITAAIWTHISSIYYLHHNHTPSIPLPLFNTLHSLTVHAALLSLHMRIDSHTVYHFTPAFKDQPFTRTAMECFNEAEMISTHPLGSGDKDMISKAEQERRETLDAKELQRMKRDQALVQISLLPGMTAYRRGGWEALSSTAEKPVFESGCEGRGVRVRVLTDAWVSCRWGRPRVFRDGKPADDERVHGVGWREDGFVEFFPGVKGVVNPW
jgi:hypothetical protein